MLATMAQAVSQIAQSALPIADQSFWHEHGDEVSAAITLIVTFVIAYVYAWRKGVFKWR